jgi:FG-GAP-like repeat
VLPGDGDGTFQGPVDHAVAGGTVYSLAVGDFNGDGRADIAVANKTDSTVTVLLSGGNGAFTAEPPVPTGATPGGLVAADFTGDGRADLAVTNFAGGTVSVFDRNAANTGFDQEAGSPIAVSANPLGITLADVDVDGRQDLAIAANSGAVDTLRRSAAGGFTRDPAISLPGHQNAVAAGDFDGDGRPDLAVSEILDANVFNVLLNPAPVAPAPAPTPTATPLPAPVAGKTVNGARKSGKVTFRKPGSKKFVTLTAKAQIPVGSVIDTRKGRIAITAAQGKGKTATADFFDGLFKLTQTKGAKPATTLSLTEKLSCPKGKKASAAAKKKKSRRLWGSGHGRFTTKGSYSAATVRGTKWLVQDTCTSTTTKVAAGVVAVRDLVRHKTIVVRKGKRYVAHRKR